MSEAAFIRRLTAVDAERFAALRREVTADNPVGMGLTLEEELKRPIEGFRTQLSYPEPNAAFGAFVQDELVASAAVAWPSHFPSSRHKVNLWGVFVAPSARGRGLGRQLVQTAIAHAFDNGVRRVNLLVYVPNEPALSLYRALGFEACGREPEAIFLSGTYHDGVHMSLTQ
jgi:ribosomal protein S18 acetylase RimI-like enzyme